MKVSNIATKVLKIDDDGEVSFAIKALVENDSNSEDVYVSLQGLDNEGFEVYEMMLTGKISTGESKVLTTSDYVEEKIFEQIINWQEK